MKLVISTMKNEAPWLLEWLAYHQVIGFDSFLIYTNDCTDGTDFMLERLTALGHVTHQRNKVLRRGPHKSALKYAFQHPLMQKADWVYVTDADEFLNVRAGAGMVDDLISAWPGADAIPVTWRIFSASGQTDFPLASCLEAFTDAEPEVAADRNKKRFVKSLFRPDPRLAKLGLHAPDYTPEARAGINWGSDYVRKNPDGEPRRPASDYGYDTAQVNHYAVRSVDAYLLKRDRGRANHVGETLKLDYWQRWNKGGTRDKTILRHKKAVRARLRELRKDPELAFLERAAIALSTQRLAELKADPDFAKLRQDIVGPENENLSAVRRANAGMKLRSPSRHKNRRAFLRRMPKGGRCAEIGVWQGSFTLEILDVTQPSELILIDPWGLLADQEESEWTHAKHKDSAGMDRMYRDVLDEFESDERVSVRKGFSADLLAEYADGYFDWVYIDGNHLYDFVRKDIELSARKVRQGGIIAGDDYRWSKDGRLHVQDAVQDAMAALKLGPEALMVKGQQYMIRL